MRKDNHFEPPEDTEPQEFKCPCDQYCLNPNNCPNK